MSSRPELLRSTAPCSSFHWHFASSPSSSDPPGDEFRWSQLERAKVGVLAGKQPGTVPADRLMTQSLIARRMKTDHG